MHVVVGTPHVASNTRTTKMRLQEKKENDKNINYKRSREQSITPKHTVVPFPSPVTATCQGATQKKRRCCVVKESKHEEGRAESAGSKGGDESLCKYFERYCQLGQR